MTRKNQRWLLICFKTLADENRLALLGLLAQRDYELNELVQVLNMSETVVAEHLLKLRTAGLVYVRGQCYSVDPAALRNFKAAVQQVEQVQQENPSDADWIDALKLTDAEAKVLRDYTLNGRIQSLPMHSNKKLSVIVRWLATKFQTGVDYTGQEVNTILTEYHEDYATLRRLLVDFCMMARKRDGSRYWRIPQHE